MRAHSPKSKNASLWLVGKHAVLAAVVNNRRKVFELWLTPETQKEVGKQLPELPGVSVHVKPRADFDKQFPQKVHQGIAARVGELADISLHDILVQQPTRLVMLDQITDPHNLGAILRTCDALGVQAVLTPNHHTAEVNDVVAKAASGAMETVPIVNVGNLNQAIETLKKQNFWVLGLASEGEENISTLTPPEKWCLVLGSEGEGLRRLVRENCDALVRIPLRGTVDSLNVSNAAAVAIFMLSK